MTSLLRRASRSVSANHPPDQGMPLVLYGLERPAEQCGNQAAGGPRQAIARGAHGPAQGTSWAWLATVRPAGQDGAVEQLGFAGMPRRLYACTPTRLGAWLDCPRRDRKSTRLNSSHLGISYAVFC